MGVFFRWAVVCASLFVASVVVASDDVVFDPQGDRETGNLPRIDTFGETFSTTFKKIPGDEALNQWSVDLQTGAVEQRSSKVGASEWKNLYLAFALDVRYGRDCHGSKTTALCTFLRSSVQVSGSFEWNDSSQTQRFAVVLVPLEYVTGTFSKSGLDLGITNGALYATIGARAEFLRDLGLEIQRRVIGAISASLNYASPQQALGPDAAFHWIGSVRLFAGGGAAEYTATGTQGAISGGIETQIGLAFDLAKGSLAFTNTSRMEGDIGIGGGGLFSGLITEKLELKYLRLVCPRDKSGKCTSPTSLSYGGGVRYEYTTSSYEPVNAAQSIHRLIFFAELARF